MRDEPIRFMGRKAKYTFTHKVSDTLHADVAGTGTCRVLREK